MSTNLGFDGSGPETATHKEVIVSGVNLSLTEALKQAVHHGCEKLFHHSQDILKISVVLTHDGSHKPNYVAKGIVSIYGPDLVVSATDPDLYKAIHLLAAKLDRKLRTKHGKKLAKRHNHLTTA